jgi:hypothetical protein
MTTHHASDPGRRPSPRLQKQLKSATVVSLLLTLCYCVVICCVLYFPQHIGAADNGDYWRYAETAGVNGVESFHDDEYPYMYQFYDQWLWLPFSAELLSPLRPQLSNAYPISMVRLFTNVFGDTAVNHYQIWYLSLVCIPLLLFGVYFIFRFGLLSVGKWGFVFMLAGIFLMAGSTHMGYLHSFYGESMMYVWLVVLLGCACGAIIARKGSISGKLFCVAAAISAHMMLTSKGQSVVAFPVWFVVVLALSWCHFVDKKAPPNNRKKAVNTVLLLGIVGLMIFSGVSCVKLYNWNSGTISKYNVYNSLLNGLLPLVDDPEETLEELGLDPILAQDTGESGFSSELLYPLHTDEAQKMVFDKVGVMDIFKYYLTHPVYMYRVLQTTAECSAEYKTDLLLERYTGGNGETAYRYADKFAFWQHIRPYIVPRSFLLYAVIYLCLFSVCIYSLIRNRSKPRKRLSALLFMGLMLTGLLQFPLPVIGNGLADPNKQLYLFMLTYDLTMLVTCCWIFIAVRKRVLTARKLKTAEIHRTHHAPRARDGRT